MKKIKVKNSAQKHGIEVIDSSNPNFDAELLKHVGGDQSLVQYVEAAKPFVLLVKNNTNKDVVGISLVWEFLDLKGLTQSAPTQNTRPEVLTNPTFRASDKATKYSLIPKRGLRFFSYIPTDIDSFVERANWNLENPKEKYMTQNPGSETIAITDTAKKDLLKQYLDFAVSVDGVLFSDGNFVGDDKGYYFDSVRGYLQAEEDFTNNVMSAGQRGENNSQILTNLVSALPVLKAEALPKSGEKPQKPAVPLGRDSVFKEAYENQLAARRRHLEFIRTKQSDLLIVKRLKYKSAKSKGGIIKLHKSK